MPFTDEPVMLTLAGLAYRGFHDLLRGQSHVHAVQRALLDGLHTLEPVRDEWTLVWGPATSRSGPDLFDAAAMYVVQSRREPTRYVVAIRGTNPVAASDWLMGDFWVGTTVPWPYAPSADGAAISASTALGFSKLQAMRSPRLSLAPAVDAGAPARDLDALAGQIDGIDTSWRRLASEPTMWLRDEVERLKRATALRWENLRPRSQAAPPAEAGLDLLGFLAGEAQAATGPLDVVVTGHSKGGALAPVVALWLRELLASPDGHERWDVERGARVSCHAFAGPTPGNAGLADRIDRVLGADHHHLRNANDVVTHAWQVDELEEIPSLYAPRGAGLERLIGLVVAKTREIGYRQARTGVTTFAGRLDASRSFASEFVHQHLEAYLAELKLLEAGVRPLALFF
jgi:hypothetical protein